MERTHLNPKKVVTVATAALAALVLAAPAGAWVDPTDGRQAGNGHGSMPSQFADETSNVEVIPYLSHGQGVAASDLAAASSAQSSSAALDVHLKNAIAGAQNEQTVIPYLSHGEGVHPSFGISEAIVGDEPTTAPVVNVTATDDGFEWSPTALGITAAIAAALLMAVTMVGVTQGRRRRMASL